LYAPSHIAIESSQPMKGMPRKIAEKREHHQRDERGAADRIQDDRGDALPERFRGAAAAAGVSRSLCGCLCDAAPACL
jgi:hypothetical protein